MIELPEKLRARIQTAQTVSAMVPPPSKPNDGMDKLRLRKGMMELGINQPQEVAEIARIVRLPIVRPMAPEELEEFNRDHLLATAFESGFRLFPIQAEGLSAYEMFNGAFCPVGVGFGKTLLSLMIAHAAYIRGKTRMMLLVPPEVLSQLVETDIKWARSRVPISYPIHVLGGREMAGRMSLSRSRQNGLYILPYSLLSTKDTSENLKNIEPELVICDEAHKLANRSSARTRRMISYLEHFKPQVCALSGTITSKSVGDYWHLIKSALGENNPLPNAAALAFEWGGLIDAEAESSNTGPILPLVMWARKNFPDGDYPEDTTGFRRAYKVRLVSAPGVVSSGDATIGTSLVLCPESVEKPEVVEGWEKLQELIDQVETQWLTPNGDEIEHAIHTYKWMYELNAGFYNELVWPTVTQYAERKNISRDEAESILVKAIEHHSYGQEYARELREWLMTQSKPGIDTPFLVGSDMARNGDANVGEVLYSLWKQWKDSDFEGRPDRDSHAVRVCPYKINRTVEWVKGIEGGCILWVYHQEIGKWLHEALRSAGVDSLHCPAGDKANDEIRDPANAQRIVVASMTAHGTGKNLQHFSNQYFVQWPRSAVMAEQTLGRTHRSGQKADELLVALNTSTLFDEMVFAACVNDALYIHQTTGNRQKLIYASYNPMPKIFPSAVLIEKGFDNKRLNKEQEQMLKDKFGSKT